MAAKVDNSTASTMSAVSMMTTPTILDLLNYENPVLRNYAFWAALLIIKVGLMSLLTSVQRYRSKVLYNIRWFKEHYTLKHSATIFQWKKK